MNTIILGCWVATGLINPELIKAIIRVESNNGAQIYHYNPNGSHDLGYMQINSNTVPGLNGYKLLTDKCYNIRTGVELLKDLQRRMYNRPLWYSAYHTGVSGFYKHIERRHNYINKLRDAGYYEQK